MALRMILKAARLNAMISFDQANRTSSCHQGLEGTDILIYNDKRYKKHLAIFNEKSVTRAQKRLCTNCSPFKNQESMNGIFQYEIAVALMRTI